ncbi:MAG: heme exporter protein CcmD [Proteobacteria bacterium]|nr:heme exporter protein CcmD [Pseudomonadota bacterium]
MYFDSVSAALHMAGHGVYVWSAYLITVAVVAAVLVLPLRREKAFIRQLQGTLKRQQRDKSDASGT